jgi:FkbM family methyltransferase
MILDFNSLLSKYQLNITGIIHIGAHHADEHDLYLSNGIKNIIYFEPIKKNYEVLKNKVGNNFTTYNFALGNIDGEIEMFVENDNRSMSCSILKPALHVTQYPWIRFTDKELVNIKKLDSFDINTKNFNMINIDVQGYELEVFKGSEKTLLGIDYIMTEINRDEVYENCAKVDELCNYLSKYGFELVEQDWAGNTWGDGFFIKKK